MTERRQVWLIVAACLVLYAAIMVGFSAAIREPVKWGIDWLVSMLGLGGTGILFGAVWVAGVAWLVFTNRDYVPPPRPQLPRWLHLIGHAYLLLLGVGLAIVFAVIAIRG
jgi:hypothetical protein